MNKVVFTYIVKENKPKRSFFKEYLLAFLCGGMIGVLAQGFTDFYSYLGLEVTDSQTMAGLSIVAITGLLTVLSIYKELAQLFGAGLFVPISGFSNSMVSSSFEGKSEGFIQGIGSRTFSLAGSVIVYGVFFSVFVVLIRYVLSFFGVSI